MFNKSEHSCLLEITFRYFRIFRYIIYIYICAVNDSRFRTLMYKLNVNVLNEALNYSVQPYLILNIFTKCQTTINPGINVQNACVNAPTNMFDICIFVQHVSTYFIHAWGC